MSSVPLPLTPYWQERGNIVYHDGLLLGRSCILIPEKLRRSVLENLHEGHQGTTRCRALARQSVWWPGHSTQLAVLVKKCGTYAKYREARAEPIQTKTPSLSWQVVATNIFHFRQNDYLLLVDYRSRYPEIALLPSLP